MTTIDWAAIAQRPAELVLVAGPNGSGKTTLAESYIARRFPIWPKLNADRLLLGLERLRHLGGPVEMLAADHPASRGLAPLVGTAALHVASP